MLNAPTKTKEKPSIASKKVLKTHHKNGTESYLLTEKIKTLEHKKSQKNIEIDMEVNSLKKKMEAVQCVKEKISLSKERRMLLKSQGYTIRVCKGKKEDDIILRRDSLQVDAGNWATLLANPPDLTPQGEAMDLQHLEESVENSSSSSESRPKERMRSFSFSTAVDSRSAPRYRVIEPPLRPGSRRGFITLSTTPTPKKEQEIHQERDDNFSTTSERAPSRWDVIKNRPLSGRSLFVEAVIAARDSNYSKNSQEIARERMENYRRRKFKSLSSRRTMSAPVMKMRSAMQGNKNQQEESDEKKGMQSASEVKPFDSNDQENSSNFKSFQSDSSIERKQETSEDIRATSEGNLIKETKPGGSNRDQRDCMCLPSGPDTTLTSSSIEKKNSSTQDNSISSAVERGTQGHEAERNEEPDTLRHSLSSSNEEPNERSKNVSKCNEFLPYETSKMSNVEVDDDTVNPALLIEEEVVSLEHTDGNKSSFKNKDVRSACALESEPAVQETSGKTYLSLPKTSRMSIRRHSSDDCEINEVRFHENGTRNQDTSKDSDCKGHVTLQVPRINLLNRRMSHPPRLASFQGADRLRRRKTLKNEDEVVYAYDARPDKSLAKGYRAMQMTVGGRQVKLNMPAFPKESGNMTDRTKLNTKLASLRGKN